MRTKGKISMAAAQNLAKILVDAHKVASSLGDKGARSAVINVAADIYYDLLSVRAQTQIYARAKPAETGWQVLLREAGWQ